ncbi:hypothetical protein MFM001_28640 [Mycobacterium sp. MFM001]|nr:hypothetical protein MFM001_28640 [Mycobacterium sp. MFM001]
MQVVSFCRLYSRYVRSLRVHPAGLGALADHCEALAERLTSVTPPASGGAGGTIAAAVNAVHTDIDTASAALVARMQMTAAKLSAASAAYAGQDAGSASDLDRAAEFLPAVGK